MDGGGLDVMALHHLHIQVSRHLSADPPPLQKKHHHTLLTMYCKAAAVTLYPARL